jgi:hypothetical protein
MAIRDVEKQTIPPPKTSGSSSPSGWLVVTCQGVKRVRTARPDLVRLSHLLLECGIVGRKPVVTFGCCDQKKPFQAARVQSAHHFSRQDPTGGVAESADLTVQPSSTMIPPADVTLVVTFRANLQAKDGICLSFEWLPTQGQVKEFLPVRHSGEVELRSRERGGDARRSIASLTRWLRLDFRAAGNIVYL